MRELFISIILKLVDHHCRHLGHRVVHTLHPTIVIRVVGAGGNFPNPKNRVDGMRKLRAKLEAVVREYVARASPEGNAPVDGNVRRALSCELGCNDCGRVGSAAETVSEEQYVGVTSRRYREEGGIIDVYNSAGPFRQGHRDDGPTDRQPRGFPLMTLQLVVKQIPGADVHTNPPAKRSSICGVCAVLRRKETVEG